MDRQPRAPLPDVLPLYEAQRDRLTAEIAERENQLIAVLDLIKAHRNFTAAMNGTPPPRAKPGRKPARGTGDGEPENSANGIAARYVATLPPDTEIVVRDATDWALAHGWNTASRRPVGAMARALGALERRHVIRKLPGHGGYRTLPSFGEFA